MAEIESALPLEHRRKQFQTISSGEELFCNLLVVDDNAEAITIQKDYHSVSVFMGGVISKQKD